MRGVGIQHALDYKKGFDEDRAMEKTMAKRWAKTGLKTNGLSVDVG